MQFLGVEKINFQAGSPEQTSAIARAFAVVMQGGDTVSLEGELGAGKTFFVRALAAALGSGDSVASPTFVLQRVYSIPQPAPIRTILHYDLYRLNSPHELGDIGFDEVPDDAIALVEWGDKFPGALPPAAIRVRIALTGDESRSFEFHIPEPERAQEFRALL